MTVNGAATILSNSDRSTLRRNEIDVRHIEGARKLLRVDAKLQCSIVASSLVSNDINHRHSHSRKTSWQCDKILQSRRERIWRLPVNREPNVNGVQFSSSRTDRDCSTRKDAIICDAQDQTIRSEWRNGRPK